MTNQTPGQDQQQINSIPWTNGKGLVTGATVSAILTAMVGTFYLYAALAGNNTFTGTNVFTGAVTLPNGTAIPHASGLAGLRALTGGVSTSAIRDYYASLGDAPPMIYEWLPTCPSAADNVALYIAPNTGSAGCWSAAKDPNINNPREMGVSASNASTNGSISASSPSLSLTAAQDFANGEGIRINHAGAPFALNQATSCSATPGGTTGSTTYQYEIAAIDAAGGVGEVTASFQTTTGNATLSVLNYISIACTAPSGTAPAGYAVYRNVGGTYTLVGFVNSASLAYYDMGYGVSAVGAPDYVPTTAPASSLPDWFITTIASGGGSTTLTLATNATTAASGVGVYHDDTAALSEAVTLVQENSSNAIDLPPGQINVTGNFAVADPQFRIRGFGVNSIVYRVNPAGDLFTFTGGKDLLRDFFVQANALQTGGYLFDFGTYGNNTLSNVRTYGGPSAVNLGIGGSSQNYVVDSVFDAFNQVGIYGPSGIGGPNYISGVTMQVEPQIVLGHPESRGLSILGGATWNIVNSNIGGQYSPCFIQPAAGVTTTDIEANALACDGQGTVGPFSLSGNALTMDGSNSGSYLWRFRGTNVWAGSVGGHGMVFKDLSDGFCHGCASEANGGHGVQFIGTHGFEWGGTTAGNNFYKTSLSTTYNGIDVDATSSAIKFSGFSGTNIFAANTQIYGWNVASGATNVSFCGTQGTGNVTANYDIGGSTSAPSCTNY